MADYKDRAGTARSTARSGASGTTAAVAVLPLSGTTGTTAVLPLDLGSSRTGQFGCYSFFITSFAVLTLMLSFYAITGSGRQGGGHTKRAAKRSQSGKDIAADDESEIMPEKTTRRQKSVAAKLKAARASVSTSCLHKNL